MVYGLYHRPITDGVLFMCRIRIRSDARVIYSLQERQCFNIVNTYDMVWKPFVLGDCVPCAGSRLKNPLSFYCLTIVSSESLAKGMGTKCLFCLPGLYLTAYLANNEVLPPFFDGECLCYIVWSILID
jgi:hypothetical protein